MPSPSASASSPTSNAMPTPDPRTPPLVKARRDFDRALDCYVQEVNLLVNAVESVLAVDGVLKNAKVRAMLETRVAATRAARIG